MPYTTASVNAGTGWAQYGDTQYTNLSPFVITSGTEVNIPNNAGSNIVNHLPPNVSSLYNGTDILAQNSGDGYIWRLAFTGFSSAAQGEYAVKMDISAARDGSGIILATPVKMLKGSGSGNASIYSMEFDGYSLSTFIANGARFRIESISGNLSMYNITYFIKRDHRA